MTNRTEFGHLGGCWIGDGPMKWYYCPLLCDGPWRDMADWEVSDD